MPGVPRLAVSFIIIILGSGRHGRHDRLLVVGRREDDRGGGAARVHKGKKRHQARTSPCQFPRD